MRNEKGYLTYELVVLIVFVIGMTAWIFNGLKLLDCDFESDYSAK